MFKQKNKMKNLFAENRLVFMSGPEITRSAERISTQEAKQLDYKLNSLTKKFDGLKPEFINTVMKKEIGKNLEETVIKALKKKLDPYNQENANSLFGIIYPPNKLAPIIKKAVQKLNQAKFNVSEKNMENLKFSSKTRFANLLAAECGIINTDEPTTSIGDKPWENLGSKLAPQANPLKLRNAVKKSGKLIEKAFIVATKNEMRQEAISQIKNIIESVA